jgi:hypothetical protein
MGWIILKHANDVNDGWWKNIRTLINFRWQRSWKWRAKTKNRKLINWWSFLDFVRANWSKQQSKLAKLEKRNSNISLNTIKRSIIKCEFDTKWFIKYTIESINGFSTNRSEIAKGMLNCK